MDDCWSSHSNILSGYSTLTRNRACPGADVPALQRTSNPEYWQIKITDFENKKILQCYKCKNWQLFKRKEELEYNFAKNIFCKRLIKMCNGKILINHSSHTIALKFPSKDSPENVHQHTAIQIESNPAEERTVSRKNILIHHRTV